MEHRIVFATGNEGKMREVRLILADLGMEILSMKEAGADPDIVERPSARMRRSRPGRSGSRPAASCWRTTPAWSSTG